MHELWPATTHEWNSGSARPQAEERRLRRVGVIPFRVLEDERDPWTPRHDHVMARAEIGRSSPRTELNCQIDTVNVNIQSTVISCRFKETPDR